MANPNIVSVSTILGKITNIIASTTPSAIVTNSSGSGKVLKINSIIASNFSGGDVDITIDLYKNQTTSFKLAFTNTVPSKASSVVLSNGTSIYLEENDSIRVSASVNGTVDVSCSYSEISSTQSAVTYESLAASAQIWLTTTTLSAIPDSTQITSWVNQGAGGSAYNATESTLGPLKVTYGGHPALQFNSSSYKKLNLATEIDVTTGSFFMVGYQTSSRMIALGGSLDSSSGACFFGYSGTDGSLVLLRNTSDSGYTSSTLTSVAGLKAFGIVKTSTTALSYYDNTPTETTSTGISGTYRFKKIGTRDYGSLDSQPSTGYLTEVLYFNTALSSTDAAIVMAGLKAKYGIT